MLEAVVWIVEVASELGVRPRRTLEGVAAEDLAGAFLAVLRKLFFVKITLALDYGAKVDVEPFGLPRLRRALLCLIPLLRVLPELLLGPRGFQLARLLVEALLRFLPRLPLQLRRDEVDSPASVTPLELRLGVCRRALGLILEM